MRAGRVAVSSVVLVGVLTVLSACSEPTPASDTLPPLSSTAAPTLAPSTTTPGLPPQGPPDFPVPPEARTHDDAGAIAFLRYYLDLIDHQATIPAGQPLRDLGPDCDECLRLARSFDEVAAAGQHYVGGDLTLVSTAPPFPKSGGTEINFLATGAAESVVDAAGNVIESVPADDQLGSGVNLQWSDELQAWYVGSITIG